MEKYKERDEKGLCGHSKFDIMDARKVQRVGEKGQRKKRSKGGITCHLQREIFN